MGKSLLGLIKEEDLLVKNIRYYKGDILFWKKVIEENTNYSEAMERIKECEKQLKDATEELNEVRIQLKLYLSEIDKIKV